MNNDLISREALKKKLTPIKLFNGGYCKAITEKDIDNAPTVEIPTELCKDCRFLKDCETCEEKLRPQGEWKETGYETGALGITYRQTQCSNCGWEHALPMWWNFCPNCGAKMQKGGAEND